jgi:hypothetical protein
MDETTRTILYQDAQEYIINLAIEKGCLDEALIELVQEHRLTKRLELTKDYDI